MKTITFKKKHLLLSSNKNILAVFFLLIFSGLLKAGPEEQTITNIIAEQYLGPYYTWHQQLDMKIHGYEDHLKNNPQVKPSQEDQQILKNLKTKDLDITNYLNNNKTIFGLFSLNELFSTTPWINLIDFKHYENDLYITHSNNEKNLEDHLLSQLARYTHLKCGYLRCAKILGMPTKDVIQLKKTQNVSKALLNDQKLYDDIELHLKQIEEQGLESSFLSSWKNDFVQQIYSTAPYPSNAVAIQLLNKIHTIKKNNPDKEFLNSIDTSTEFVRYLDFDTIATTTTMMTTICGMLWALGTNVIQAGSELNNDVHNYLGGWLKLALFTISIPCIRQCIKKIVDFSLNQHMKKEYIVFTNFCKNHNITLPITTTTTAGKITLVFNNVQEVAAAQDIVDKNMQNCQTSAEKNILLIKLTSTEERKFRLSHPLMHHNNIITVVLPCIAYLIYCWYNSTNFFPNWFKIPFTGQTANGTRTTNFQNQNSIEHFTAEIQNTATYMPGIGALQAPWHIKSMLSTTFFVIPTTIYFNLWYPCKNLFFTSTQSIQQARKVIFDLAKLVDHAKKIRSILIEKPSLKNNLYEIIEDLDIEKCLDKKISNLKSLFQSNKLDQTSEGKNLLNQTITHFEKQKEQLDTLLTTLHEYLDETESIESHHWFSGAGFVKNIKIRLGSHKILAAYKLFNSTKDLFAPMIEALGEIDRKRAEVKLLKEFEQKNVTFCFAEYEYQINPHIYAEKLWLPHLLGKTAPENIVPNTIEMGKNGMASTIILSGPTEGGKSTFERSLAVATLMAQTLGIVPAKRWIATPFDQVVMSFNTMDNLGKTVDNNADTDNKKGTSGFRAEMESIKKIVNEHDKDKRILVIIDELFQKVQGPSGDFLSYSIILQNFVKQDNMLSVISSHREQPKYLEQETGGLCQNYHFKIKDAYALEPGALQRKEHKFVTKEEIISNEEDEKNLKLAQELGLLSSF